MTVTQTEIHPATPERWADLGTFTGPRTTTLSPITPPLRGTWRSKLSFQLNSHTHRASARGHLVLKFKAHKAGRLCIAFNTRYRIVKGKPDVRGRFHIVGGTGDSAKGRHAAASAAHWTRERPGRWTSRAAKRRPTRRTG